VAQSFTSRISRDCVRNFAGVLIAGEEVSVNGLNLLRLCLGQMGATPVDSSKITLPEDKDDAEPFR